MANLGQGELKIHFKVEEYMPFQIIFIQVLILSINVNYRNIIRLISLITGMNLTKNTPSISVKLNPS